MADMIITAAIITAAAVYLYRHYTKPADGCGGSCGGCSAMKKGCSAAETADRISSGG
ncbi:FeoB-associated Cys-rich membrane protein [Geovibrio thiophilus]|uniref:FeoB-associated Cys-rich membrane protein n=1 Tax=Geovibrio thiophilus TaxID=139438 RepID=A0A3R5Y584_9BACT|nr:FeoB-associated Cys-rich membrane protein [Geovibrio thiophilus]QAR32017.1 FeoB-associated Cys-rich membrane protein [Geovibrio thiophilus]